MQQRYSITREDKILAIVETEQEALANATMCSFRNSKDVMITDLLTNKLIYRINSGTIQNDS
jgi:hypothetical protein